MKIRVSDLLPNPFRDFSLYPYEDEQVLKLAQSIDELGFFSGVTARKAGLKYQLACGHHRIEAAKRAGLDIIEAVVDTYTDHEMVRIMCVENATQRGASQASINDSVAAHARLVAKDVLLGDGPVSKILDTANQLPQVQAVIVKDGPGMRLIYQSVNNFAKEGRKDNKEQEILTSTQIDNALQSLKSGGYMAKLVGEVYADVQAIRAEADAKAKAKADAEERARQQSVAKAEADAKRDRDYAELKAKLQKEAEERAALAQEKAAKDAEAKAEARAAVEAANKARAETVEARNRLAAAERLMSEQRQAAYRQTKQAEAAARKEQERRAEEAEAIAVLQNAPADYDTDCDQVFGSAVQSVAFRQGVLSPMGRSFLPPSQQLAFAKHVKAEIVELAKVGGHGDPNGMGSVAVKDIVQRELMVVARAQSEAEKDAKKKAAERESAKKRVERYWGDLKHASSKMAGAMLDIHNEHKSWPYADEPFPIDMGAVAHCNYLAKAINDLAKEMGLDQTYTEYDPGNSGKEARIAGLIR